MSMKRKLAEQEVALLREHVREEDKKNAVLRSHYVVVDSEARKLQVKIARLHAQLGSPLPAGKLHDVEMSLRAASPSDKSPSDKYPRGTETQQPLGPARGQENLSDPVEHKRTALPDTSLHDLQQLPSAVEIEPTSRSSTVGTAGVAQNSIAAGERQSSVTVVANAVDMPQSGLEAQLPRPPSAKAKAAASVGAASGNAGSSAGVTQTSNAANDRGGHRGQEAAGKWSAKDDAERDSQAAAQMQRQLIPARQPLPE